MLWTWTVPAEPGFCDRADRAILSALQAELGSWEGSAIPCSRSQIQRLIEEGQVHANGAPLKSNSRLREGMVIEIQFPEPKPSELVPEDRPIAVLYEDSHLLVINKPAGLTVHPSATQTEGTLVNALLHHVRDLSGIGGELRPGIVHRIDKDTSGALVITKTDAAHRKLAETFSKHAIERTYIALCYGSPKTATGRIESLIGRNPADRKKMSMKVKQGRKAVTLFRRVREYATSGRAPFASQLELTLETGRTHQIRVHLTGLGNSILGDPVYGMPSTSQPKWQALPTEIQACVRQLPGQALHAQRLGFEHPITGEPLRFEAEPPEAFRLLLAKLEEYR